MKTPSKIDPHQNVSPTQSTHFTPIAVPFIDGQTQKVSGATISSGGGCPLLLSLAGTMASALIQRNATIDAETCAIKALEFSAKLIENYNKEFDTPKSDEPQVKGGTP